MFRSALERRGFDALTAVQRAVVDRTSGQNDLRISSQTGSGKTVAIGLVLGEDLANSEVDAARGPRALIIAPTRELAMQVKGELSWLYEDLSKVRVIGCTGGTDVRREQFLLSKGPAVVVGTPGRLLDHLRTGALRLENLAHVVLDEADQMFDMGFREELESIVEALPEDRNSHLVSATFPKPVLRLADRFQKDWLSIEGTKLGAAHEDIQHVVHRVRPHDRYAVLVNTLLLLRQERCLVFVQRRADTAALAEQLAGDGFSVLPFSGDLSQPQRTRTLDAFRNGVVHILIATDVAARGIDVADIAAVVHMDLPFDTETYTHRSGRTGRAGKKGRSHLFVAPIAERRVRRMLAAAKVEGEWCPPPTPKGIHKSMTKRTRKALKAALANPEPSTDNQREYAARLLEANDPVTLVARLLELAEPTLPREPIMVESAPAYTESRRDRRPRKSPRHGKRSSELDQRRPARRKKQRS